MNDVIKTLYHIDQVYQYSFGQISVNKNTLSSFILQLLVRFPLPRPDNFNETYNHKNGTWNVNVHWSFNNYEISLVFEKDCIKYSVIDICSVDFYETKTINLKNRKLMIKDIDCVGKFLMKFYV